MKKKYGYLDTFCVDQSISSLNLYIYPPYNDNPTFLQDFQLIYTTEKSISLISASNLYMFA